MRVWGVQGALNFGPPKKNIVFHCAFHRWGLFVLVVSPLTGLAAFFVGWPNTRDLHGGLERPRGDPTWARGCDVPDSLHHWSWIQTDRWQCDLCLRTTSALPQFERKCCTMPPKFTETVTLDHGHHFWASNRWENHNLQGCLFGVLGVL